MGSLLVLVVLLGMWGFVLVPLVRQQQQRSNELRSVTRFSSALRVLSRGDHVAPGMRQWVMPPREGFDAARRRREHPAEPRSAAGRRRRLLAALAGLTVLSLLMVVVGGRKLLVLQVIADVALVVGLAACRWSAEQERLSARRRVRSAARTAQDRRHEPAPMPSRSAPVTAASRAQLQGSSSWGEIPVVTVPLDAPPMPRRAVLDPEVAGAPATSGPQRPARPSVPAPEPVAATAPRRPGKLVPRPRTDLVELAEIEVDWEPFIHEPASGVRVLDLTGSGPRRQPLFDDADHSIDLGDDEGLDNLVARRARASGW